MGQLHNMEERFRGTGGIEDQVTGDRWWKHRPNDGWVSGWWPRQGKNRPGPRYTRYSIANHGAYSRWIDQ